MHVIPTKRLTATGRAPESDFKNLAVLSFFSLRFLSLFLAVSFQLIPSRTLTILVVKHRNCLVHQYRRSTYYPQVYAITSTHRHLLTASTTCTRKPHMRTKDWEKIFIRYVQKHTLKTTRSHPKHTVPATPRLTITARREGESLDPPTPYATHIITPSATPNHPIQHPPALTPRNIPQPPHTPCFTPKPPHIASARFQGPHTTRH